MKYKARVLTVSAVIVIFLCISALMVLNGVIQLNNPSVKDYPVRGVDISSWQGTADWDVLSQQNIKFVYIKATEGSSFVDKNFKDNYTNAHKTDLAVGAYHFFSYDSDGKAQAVHFIKTVPETDGMLPPVIDLEFYGDKEKNPVKKSTVIPQLNAMLEELESYYGKKPIIYATEKSYKLYLEGGFSDTDIWIRSVYSKPHISDRRKWTFWQYTDRAKLDGYNGKEKYIDFNVFNGSEDEFRKLIK